MENYSLGFHGTRLSHSSPFKQFMRLKIRHKRVPQTWGPKSLPLTFGHGSFLCTSYIFCHIPWGTEKVHLAATNKEGNINCNQSNWAISLNIKEAGRNRKGRKGVHMPDPGVCMQISFHPSLPKIWFAGNDCNSQGGSSP